MLASRTLRCHNPCCSRYSCPGRRLVLVPTVAMAQHGYAQKPVPSGLVAVIANDPSQPLDLKPFSNPLH